MCLFLLVSCLLPSLSFPNTHTNWNTHTVQVGFNWFILLSFLMAHFHKSHVSVFVARGTLTRGHSPNTEHIKTLKTLPKHSADRLYGHIHQRREEVGKFHVETARKCFVISRALLKESVCVFEVCLCPHFLKSDHMLSRREGRWVQPRSWPVSVCLPCSVHTHAHKSSGVKVHI